MALSDLKKQFKYRAYIVLGRKNVECRVIYDEIPESITINHKVYRLKLVLWNCNNKASLDTHKFVELQALVYR
jgi:hypothetical protein